MSAREKSAATGGAFGVVGAGTMGRGIAQVALAGGLFEKVILVDSVPAQLEAASEEIARGLKGQEDKTPPALVTSTDLESLGDCGLVVEAVPEKEETKKEVIARLSPCLSEEAILATNTSAIPITRLARYSARPANFLGLHFMNPAPLMRGVEVIPGLLTAEDTTRKVLALATALGKEPLLCRDRAGFVVNRLLIPMLNDAMTALEEGSCAPRELEGYFTRDPSGPRQRMGPLMLADIIGLDVVHAILTVLEDELGEAYAPSRLLTRMLEEGRLGRKSGAGFYLWSRGRPGRLDPGLSATPGEAATHREPAPPPAQRAWLLAFNEALKILEEGIAGPQTVEKAATICLGHRRGILEALDCYGLERALAELRQAASRHGPRYRPAALLRRLVEAGFAGKDGARGLFRRDETGRKVDTHPLLSRFLPPAPAWSSP